MEVCAFLRKFQLSRDKEKDSEPILLAEIDAKWWQACCLLCLYFLQPFLIHFGSWFTRIFKEMSSQIVTLLLLSFTNVFLFSWQLFWSNSLGVSKQQLLRNVGRDADCCVVVAFVLDRERENDKKREWESVCVCVFVCV